MGGGVGGGTQAEAGARLGSPARSQLIFRPQRSRVCWGRWGGGGAIPCFLLGLFCSQQVEGRFLGHEGWGGLASGPSLPPPPPPATTHPLRGVNYFSISYLKGQSPSTLRGGGGRGWRGGELRSCMLGEGGGTPGTGTELAKVNMICHHKRYT